MKSFELLHAESFEEASRLLSEDTNEKRDILAGGTDVLNEYKEEILPEQPAKVIDIKRIEGASGIEENEDSVTVKTLTTLSELGKSEVVPDALREAARSVATPILRNLGTVGGNLCQDVRCWYYRYPHSVGGRLECERKGGDTCYAPKGDNRYHSIFGGMKVHSNACTKGCPAGTNIPLYMSKLRAGDIDGAARTILSVNPMPMITSRICPHPCQDGCNQTKYGDSVNIHAVERAVGDYILEHGADYYRRPAKETGKKIAIVGAGPAGLSAAYFLRNYGHDVTVYDAHEKAGGVLRYGIPIYRLSRDVLDRLIALLEGMGVKFMLNTSVGKDIRFEDMIAQNDRVFIGTGAWKQPILGITGEQSTLFGLNFLSEVNTYLKAAIGKNVLVCGGGNVAMDVALTAKRLGAANVRLVCLEQRNEMPASAEEIARAEEEGVKIDNGWGLKSVLTDDHGAVSGLQAMKCTSVYNSEHRFSPVYDENELTTFDADTIILATGQRVDLSFLGEQFGSELMTQRGLMEVSPETFRTRNEKIYAGGDAQTGPNIAIRAVHAGKAAAEAMNTSLGEDSVKCACDRKGFLSYDTEGIKKSTSTKERELPVEKRNLTDEDASSLRLDEALEEAGRCMNCGCYSVNASDLSNVVLMLDGTIVTTKKEISAVDFFTEKMDPKDMLDRGELVKEIRVPKMEGYLTGYEKSRIRKSLDFAITAVAWAVKIQGGVIEDVKLAAGGVAPVPVRLYEVEEYLKGRSISRELCEEAGKLAVKNTHPMEKNHYKINDLQTIVTRLVEGWMNTAEKA